MRTRPRPRLAQVLVDRDIHPHQLAEMVGASPGHVAKVVAGTAPPSTLLKRAISLALAVDEDELFALLPTPASLLDDPVVVAWAKRVVEQSTAEQGLPTKLTDPVILRRIATVLAPKSAEVVTG